MIMTVRLEVEKITMSGLKEVDVICAGNFNCLSISATRIQSLAHNKIPLTEEFLEEKDDEPALTNAILKSVSK